jgi:bifunctional non-homologous end joining protein LigD
VEHAANGITDFSVLQNELKARSRKIVLVAFDLLYLNGYYLRKVPLFERKALLKMIIADAEVPFSESEVDRPHMFRARLQGPSGRRRLKSTRQPLHLRPHQ